MVSSGSANPIRRPEAIAILAIGLLCATALVLADFLLGP